MKTQTKTQKIVTASLLAALCCVATMIVKIPTPLKGYLNLGDCIVLLSGWLLSPLYGFFAAGLGSALADIFSGYALYAPATFLIKGIMALIAKYCYCGAQAKTGNTPAKLIGGVLAELEMILGYFIFEGFLYGFLPAVINIPFNALQGAVGLIVGVMLIKVFEKNHIMMD